MKASRTLVLAYNIACVALLGAIGASSLALLSS